MLIRAIRVGIEQVVAQMQTLLRLVKESHLQRLVGIQCALQEAHHPVNLLRQL